MNIYQLNDYEWYAAETFEAAVVFAMDNCGVSREEAYDESYGDEPLDDADLDGLMFFDDIENKETCQKRTFREHLALMVQAGAEFPCFFAGCDW